jgi:hypothetical protein
MQNEPEIKCVTNVLKGYTQREEKVYLGLDYWDARRMQHLILNKYVNFIPVSFELNYLEWMTKRKNYTSQMNFLYLDINQNYNFGDRSVLLLKDKCGSKQFYLVESK